MQHINQSGIYEKLHDIRLPNPVGFWPLAPGFYLLIVMFLLLLLAIFFTIRKNYSFWQIKRKALVILRKYRDEYLRDGNSQLTCALVNELLKKIALAYYPRDLVAGLQGRDWIDFLNRTYQYDCNKIFGRKSREPIFNDLQKELLEYPYKKSQQVSLDMFFKYSEAWIKKQKKLKNKIREQLCLS